MFLRHPVDTKIIRIMLKNALIRFSVENKVEWLVFWIEHNLIKNESKGPAFCDKRKFKRVNTASDNNMIRIKRK